jgi:hypothetical protein
VSFDSIWDGRLNQTSKFFLFAAGVSGTLVILYHVVVAFRRQSQVRKSLAQMVAVAGARE